METRAPYVAVGAFVLAMIFLGFVGALYLGGVQLTTHFTRYDIYFRGAVTGLSKGAVVEYNGIPVGRVFNIEIDPHNVEQIRVTVEIEDKVVIKADAAANVETNILSGISYILISGGTEAAPPLVAKEGEVYPVIASRRSTLASLSARGPILLDQLTRIGTKLDAILNRQNRQAISQILDNTSRITGELAAHDKDFAKLAQNGNTALGSLNKLLNDVDTSYMEHDGLKDRLSRSLDRFDTTAAGVNKASQAVGRLADQARSSARNFDDHTLVAFNELLRETRVLVAGLTRLEAEVERDPSRLLFGDRREGYRPQ